MDNNLKEYWENRLTDQYNLTGVGYSSLGNYYNQWLYRLRQLVFRRKIKDLPLDWSATTVLDIGSGTGFYVNQWQELGVSHLAGIDITETAVTNLQHLYPQYHFYQANIGLQLPAPVLAKSVDIVSAFDVLFHITDDALYRQALHNIYASLKPGGYFVFSENFLHGEPLRSFHQVSRRLDTITQMLDACHFQIIDRFPMFYLMNTPVDTNSALLKGGWKLFSYAIAKSEMLGLLLGGCLFPLEQALVANCKESPTTEIMICRRPPE